VTLSSSAFIREIRGSNLFAGQFAFFFFPAAGLGLGTQAGGWLSAFHVS
jgi:hypothetical protein